MVTSISTPRQTIPYADRPIVDASGRATLDHYQFLERLRVAATTTVNNVTNIITQTNASDAQLTAVLASIATIEAEIAVIEAEIAALSPSAVESPFPPFPPPRLIPPQSPPAVVRVFTLEMFLAMDFTNAPTADPGGGRPWIKAGDLHIGA